MTFVSGWRGNSANDDRGLSSRDARPQRILGGAALAGVAFACAWTLYVNLGGQYLAGQGADQIDLAGSRGDKLDLVAPRGDRLVAVKSRPPAPSNTSASNIFAALFDPRSLGFAPGAFVKTTPTQEAREIPSAPPRGNGVPQSAASPAPPLRSPQIRNASLRDRAHADGVADRVAANTPAEPTIFGRLFGKPPKLTLAYAAPDDGIAGDGPGIASGYGGQTAVYDISARTVYMPDGTRLEAHSGYRGMLDDPRHADEKDRGVTPPDVYDLEPREALFHGVRALRLIPVDETKVFGRSGLLAHSYMLGPNGDSNGCVSFRDYDAFLQAYLNGEVKRLVVVAGRG